MAVLIILYGSDENLHDDCIKKDIKGYYANSFYKKRSVYQID